MGRINHCLLNKSLTDRSHCKKGLCYLSGMDNKAFGKKVINNEKGIDADKVVDRDSVIGTNKGFIILEKW